MSSGGRIHELWAKFLSGKGLTATEEQELTTALQTDPLLRRQLLKDVQMDGLLRVLDGGGRDAESFTREFFDRVEGQQDGTRFLRKMETRLREEAPARKPATRRSAPGRDPGLRENLFAPFLVAAALLFGIVLLFSLDSTDSPSPKNDGPRANAEQPKQAAVAEARRKAEADVARVEKARRQAEERLLALQREEERLAAELKKAESAKGEELRKKAEAAFEEALRKRKDEDLRIAQLREEQKRAEEARKELATAPEPQPLEKPRTETAVARVERAGEGDFVVTPSGKVAARAGLDLLPGQGFETAGGKSAAVLVYADKTRLEIGANTELKEFRSEGGKRLLVVHGELRAVVSRQPLNESMVLATPHGEAKVLGTTLRLSVDPDPRKGTRLDVEKGKVALKNLAEKTVLVESGHYAVAALGAEPVARPLVDKTVTLLKEEFKDVRSLLGRWEWDVPSNPRLAPQMNVRDRLEFDLSPRTADGIWPTGAGLILRSRQALPLPLRISLEVELSHNQNNLLAAVSLVPPGTEDLKDTLLVTLGDGKRTFFVGEGKATAPAAGLLWRPLEKLDAPGAWPRRERWTIDIKDNDLRLSVNGQEVLHRQHDKRAHPGYILRLEGTATGGPIPQGAYVRYFNVAVEKLDSDPKK